MLLAICAPTQVVWSGGAMQQSLPSRVQRSLPPRLKNPERVARVRARLGRRTAEVGLERVQRVLCEPTRVRILQALTTAELCVDDLAAAIDRAPAATSQHLRILRGLGLVEGTRHGTVIYYRLRNGPFPSYLQELLKLIERGEAAS
jgi:ArsR family transcriptional regulator, lead/cadmium/zinc/bismuth-responsive transcriptional repressor